MDKQALVEPLSSSEPKVWRILAVLVAIVVAIAITATAVYSIRLSDPYVRDVLALEGQANRGNAIFQLNCAGCHGINAYGKVGPSLRNVSGKRSQISLMHQITSGETPPMPKFQASPAEMADLLSFLNTL
ncbi:MAG: cytochrome c [Thermosynechococcaceae cyanobacterium]